MTRATPVILSSTLQFEIANNQSKKEELMFRSNNQPDNKPKKDSKLLKRGDSKIEHAERPNRDLFHIYKIYKEIKK